MNPLLSYRPRALQGLAACLLLCAPLAADSPATAAGTSPAAQTASAAAVSPSTSALSPTASALSPSAQSYAGFLSGTVSDLGAPLAAFLAKSGTPSLSVVAGGFRELVTGERSPLCDHLDQDLTVHLRDDTPYGVPSPSELQDAWISVGGNSADLSAPYTLKRFGRLLGVDAVVSGVYLVQAGSISITVRLMDCANGSVLWSGERTIPESAVDRGDLNNYSGSAPAGYGVQVSAPPPPPSIAAGVPLSPTAAAGSATGTAAGATSSAASLETGPLAYTYAPPPGVELEYNVHETEFSPYRVNFSLGYEYFDPMNAQFRAVVKNLTGPYIGINWADIVHIDFYLWDVASLPDLPNPVSNLFGYGTKLSVTAPMRVGHYWVFYAGLGGRFETIDLSSPDIPSEDTISFGNNSFFGELGMKAHKGPVGLESTLDYDFFANYSGYVMVKLGLYYEYTFE